MEDDGGVGEGDSVGEGEGGGNLTYTGRVAEKGMRSTTVEFSGMWRELHTGLGKYKQ